MKVVPATPCGHTGVVTERLSRCPAWQFAIIYGVSFGLGILLVDLVLWRHFSSSHWIALTVLVISFTATTTLYRQRRLRRLEAQQRYGVPGPMLPYVGLTSAPDTSQPE
jgi:hypothetical protein